MRNETMLALDRAAAIRAAFKAGREASRAKRAVAQGQYVLAMLRATNSASFARYLSTLPTVAVVAAASELREDAATAPEDTALRGAYDDAWTFGLPVLNREIWRRHVHGAGVL